jgi:hypothetical protein
MVFRKFRRQTTKNDGLSYCASSKGRFDNRPQDAILPYLNFLCNALLDAAEEFQAFAGAFFPAVFLGAG